MYMSANTQRLISKVIRAPVTILSALLSADLLAFINVHRRLKTFALFVPALILCHSAEAQFPSVGRSATPSEIAAWDIDVRPDFKGLPKGSGSVAKGQRVWEAQCESCHGTFGESNEVFTPIAGGTTKRDMEVGRVANLTRSDYPQRSTLMKLSELSALWDYINRAMPWNAPKTLSVEEVYAVTAYILNLGDIVPADFVLSDTNIAAVQQQLPNRYGLKKFSPLWEVTGKGDTQNLPCMVNCKPNLAAAVIASRLPEHARNAHGNLAEQSRLIGATLGTNTTAEAIATAASLPRPAGAAEDTGKNILGAATNQANAAKPIKSATISTVSLVQLARQHNCHTCHAQANKLIGPSYAAIAQKYQSDATALNTLMTKVRQGGAGVWGVIPMPAHPQISDDELRQLVEWNLRGGK